MRASEFKKIVEDLGVAVGLPLATEMLELQQKAEQAYWSKDMKLIRETKAQSDAVVDIYEDTAEENDALIEQNATLGAEIAELQEQLEESKAEAKSRGFIVEHCNNRITQLEIELDGALVPQEHQHEFPEKQPRFTVTREEVESAPGEKIVIKIPPEIHGLSDVDAVAAGELPPEALIPVADTPEAN